MVLSQSELLAVLEILDQAACTQSAEALIVAACPNGEALVTVRFITGPGAPMEAMIKLPGERRAEVVTGHPQLIERRARPRKYRES